MKSLITKSLLILMASFGGAFAARAVDLKLVNMNVSVTWNWDGNKAKRNEIKSLIVDQQLDFVLFFGASASSYFIDSDFDKYKVVVYDWNAGNSRCKYFIYNDNLWELKSDVFTGSIQWGKGQSFGYVVENRLTGEQFALLSCIEPYDKSDAYAQKVKSTVDAMLGAYPNARLVITYDVDRTTPENLAADLVTAGYGVVSENDDGACYTASGMEPISATSDKFFGEKFTESGYKVTIQYPNKFRVIFKDYDGTVLQNELVDEGSSVVPPTPPERTGYVFVGWDHEAAEFEDVTNHITAIAQYKILDTNYNVTFNDWNDSPISQVSVLKDTPVARPSDPVRAFYAFRAWKNGDADWDFADPVASNMTLRADYTVVPVHEIGDAPALVEILAAHLPDSVIIRLTNDIDFAAVAYTPEDFSATLDGNGHKIFGLANNARLFNTLFGTVRNLTIADVGTLVSIGEGSGILALTAEGATVANCVVENCNRQYSATGCQAGLFFQTVKKGGDGQRSFLTNCVARNSRVITASTSSNQHFGGIAATVGDADIVDCHFETANAVDVSVGGTVGFSGGIAGQVNSNTRIERCSASGRIAALESVDYCRGGAGGIAGAVGENATNVQVVGCTNSAEVTGHQANGVGGIVGRTFKGKTSVLDSVNRGAVAATYGSGSWNSNGAGGIFGSSMGESTTYIANCANYGSVEANGTGAAGGIFGNIKNSGATHFQLTNSFNYGSITAENSAGGLVGAYIGISGEGSLINSGNSGAVRCATNAVGGVVGSAQYYSNNGTLLFSGIMQAGNVVTESGSAAVVVGQIIGSSGSKLSMPLESCVLAGEASATAGGQVGSVIGEFVDSGTTIVPSLDANCRLLGTYASDYYDNANESQTLEIQPMTAGDLTSRSGAVKILNDNATTKEYVTWVRGKTYPELSLFCTEAKAGLTLFFR